MCLEIIFFCKGPVNIPDHGGLAPWDTKGKGGQPSAALSLCWLQAPAAKPPGGGDATRALTAANPFNKGCSHILHRSSVGGTSYETPWLQQEHTRCLLVPMPAPKSPQDISGAVEQFSLGPPQGVPSHHGMSSGVTGEAGGQPSGTRPLSWL